ncbi:pyridoxamine 5'-phosphate oxidase [Clostridium saccharoperbutylacetonicum]|jgi:nitroimidazol reductase NimA-like FMN-containing flavoprotein (pyridoxamine 5'-phosphate oxidase superfamily)|nr:pyridoxamine 5'-phosphate oxidase [Clostridium saccharoperbutylacetonicum]
MKGCVDMFKEMRRSDRLISTEEAKVMLEKCDYGVLSTIGENGYPYGLPINYVYKDNALYFHCATEGTKLENLKNSNKVSFCVVGDTCVLPDKFSTNYESVIVFGKANEVLGEEKNMILLELINKYSPDYIENGKKYISASIIKTNVIKIDIEHISGKARR